MKRRRQGVPDKRWTRSTQSTWRYAEWACVRSLDFRAESSSWGLTWIESKKKLDPKGSSTNLSLTQGMLNRPELNPRNNPTNLEDEKTNRRNFLFTSQKGGRIRTNVSGCIRTIKLLAGYSRIYIKGCSYRRARDRKLLSTTTSSLFFFCSFIFSDKV